jgi:hypothetical protein
MSDDPKVPVWSILLHQLSHSPSKKLMHWVINRKIPKRMDAADTDAVAVVTNAVTGAVVTDTDAVVTNADTNAVDTGAADTGAVDTNATDTNAVVTDAENMYWIYAATPVDLR